MGIWFYAQARVTRVVTLETVLTVTPPAGYQLVYQSSRQGQIRVSGPESLVSRIRSEADRAAIELHYNLSEDQLVNGRVTLPVQPRWIRKAIPEREFVQLKFSDISPQRILVVASEVIERSIPVEVLVTGHPTKGLRLSAEPASRPQEVSVRGPALLVETMKSVPTEPVELWGLTAGAHRQRTSLQGARELALGNGEKVRIPLKLAPEHIIAEFWITEEASEQKSFPDLSVTFWMPADFPYEARLEEGKVKVSVTVNGPSDVVRKLDADSLRPYVDIARLADEQLKPGEQGPYQELVHLNLPSYAAGCTTEIKPDRVTILLTNPGP